MRTAWSLVPVPVSRSSCQITRIDNHGTLTEPCLTPTDLALEAYQQAREPKRLVLLRGGHFDAYVKDFDAASGAARDWFLQHLGSPGSE